MSRLIAKTHLHFITGFRVLSPTKKGGEADTLVLQAESETQRAEWMNAIQGAIAGTLLGSSSQAPPAEGPAGRARQISMPPGHRPTRGLRQSSAALPPGWEKHQDDDGQNFYYNPKSGESTYEHPSAPALPPSLPSQVNAARLLAGWASYTDDEGCTYYHNASTGESTYTMPIDAMPQTQKRARALFSYSAASEAELSISEGDVVTIVNTELDGWWTGELRGKTGLFPSAYVEQLP